MKTGATVARILLGLIFVLSGISGFAFLFISAPPPLPGLAGTFQQVYFATHWVQFVDGVQLIAGVLLLLNRFVPLALVLLAAIIANIYVFHITMAQGGIIAPIILSALWVLVALRFRENFAPLLQARALPSI